MSPTPWLRRPVPDVDEGTLRVWHWELRSRRDLTTSRISLRQELTSSRRSAGPTEDEVEMLLLAFEELASNGLRHGRAPVTATVSATPTGWLIDVSDADSTRCPAPAVDRDPAQGGLGLHMVVALSSTHGWSVHAGRKHVWACLPRASVA
jgi:anti-sigma regulatory factor (Ser/Thr protein kinase)